MPIAGTITTNHAYHPADILKSINIKVVEIKYFYAYKITIKITKGEFFIASIEEIPAELTQGATVEEAKTNVLDALELYLEDMQQAPRFDYSGLEEELMIVA